MTRAPSVAAGELAAIEQRLERGRRVDLNGADRLALEALPGIGSTSAETILAYRRAHGPFASVETLRQVPGLMPQRVDAAGPFLHVSLPTGE